VRKLAKEKIESEELSKKLRRSSSSSSARWARATICRLSDLGRHRDQLEEKATRSTAHSAGRALKTLGEFYVPIKLHASSRRTLR